ncbi:MAG TPA: hypothetical protein VM529_23730, partial [Gemmata sp.]|nr:hypothetical protein [Gemmata sp.]
MNAIGRIPMGAETAYVEARSKVLRLARALGFDALAATRLATAVSVLARTGHRTDPLGAVTAGLITSGVPALVIDLETHAPVTTPDWVRQFLGNLRNESIDGGFRLRGERRLPDPLFRPDAEFLRLQRELFEARSREELLADVRASNLRLEEHQAQLEQTIVARTTEQQDA